MPELPPPLDAALRPHLQRAARELQQQAPDSGQDARVLAQLQQQLPLVGALGVRSVPALAAGQHLRNPLRWAAWSGTALALLAFALAALVLWVDPPKLSPAASPWARADGVDSGFLPVVSQAQWQQLRQDQQGPGQAGGDATAVWLLPAELPRERLALLGLPYDASRAESRLRTELMVDPGSGQLLAVRFLP